MSHASHHQRTVPEATPTIERSLLLQNWAFRKAGDKEWLPAKVPGNNFSDLLRHGIIPDPFYRAHEADLQWIEKEDWEYKMVFEVEANRLSLQQQLLIFYGLDTYAEVFLNDQLLLEGYNMFLGYEVDVKTFLKAGPNELRIRFRSPIREVKAQAEAAGFTYPAGNDHAEEKLSVFTRKAPYHYGWDWGPRFVTSGVWRPVEWLSFDLARLKTANLVTKSLTAQGGIALAEVVVEAVVAGDYTLSLDIAQGRWQFERPIYLEAGENKITFEVELEVAAQWWPRTWGNPVLYDLDWQLKHAAVPVDQKSGRFGLCTIKLVREADKEGHSFYFEVNGQPIFAKGANYIPQDSFLDRPTEAHYRKVFEDMAAANMNMVRVWGGGIYEADLFYDLADEYGIMVWQDFMFACTMYPGDPGFIENVKEEALYNIHRLKGHPSLALWCGNNEIAVGWQYWGWQEEYGYNEENCRLMASDYERLFEAVLPELVFEHDATRDYLPSSPIYDYSDHENYSEGDVHYWGVWHEEAPFSTYKWAVPRFMSEYGFQSFPLLDSVKRYAEPEDWSIESPVMQLHQKHPRGNGIIRKYLLEHYRAPKDFESFLYLSQLLQAEGIRIAIEAHRKAKPFCMGTLYWQLNDCWPVASWSGIDYYGQWKALHYAVRQAFSPLLVVLETETEEWIATVVSDLPEEKHLRFIVGLYRLKGERLLLEEKRITVKPNGKISLELDYLKEAADSYDPAGLWLRLQLADGGAVAYDQTAYLVPARSLNLPQPKVRYTVEPSGAQLTVHLQSEVLVRGLHLSLEGVAGNFSDNFFDLCPGEPKTVQLTLPEPPAEGWPPIRLMSVYDSYTE
ncbi:MAG: glycoside hydrolase family 2 protein [Phaeodactylibacter sp.]|uniref:beta-mannosidase n=1 Tax=Phaeodactylibacter sp. TaxID=1940289 RepID=UPI0032EF77AF